MCMFNLNTCISFFSPNKHDERESYYFAKTDLLHVDQSGFLPFTESVKQFRVRCERIDLFSHMCEKMDLQNIGYTSRIFPYIFCFHRITVIALSAKFELSALESVVKTIQRNVDVKPGVNCMVQT